MNLPLIKKLLALSESNNVNEAALAFAKAKAMADAEGLDLAVVAAQMGTEQQREEMVKDVATFGKRMPVVLKFVDWLMEKFFKVQLVYSGGRFSGRTLTFLGRKSDVEFARFAHSFLMDDFVRRWNYYKNTNNLGVRERNAYYWGLYQGFKQKLEEAATEQESAKIAPLEVDVKNRYSLAVVSEKAAIKAFMMKEFPRLRTASATHITNLNRQDVIADGRAAGRTISVHRPLAI